MLNAASLLDLLYNPRNPPALLPTQRPRLRNLYSIPFVASDQVVSFEPSRADNRFTVQRVLRPSLDLNDHRLRHLVGDDETFPHFSADNSLFAWCGLAHLDSSLLLRHQCEDPCDVMPSGPHSRRIRCPAKNKVSAPDVKGDALLLQHLFQFSHALLSELCRLLVFHPMQPPQPVAAPRAFPPRQPRSPS